MVSRRFRNGRDDMAKKRSKRASKTSARRSKRKGTAGAAVPRRAQPKGVINAWEDDPGAGAQPSGGQVIQRPVPVLRDQPLPLRIVHPASAPEAKPHPPGTAEFRYWTAAEALRRGADFWRALLPGKSWEVGSILPVDLDFGVDLNAFYDREGLKFFHGTAAGRTVFSGESPDVVCHELGHALLDSFKPQLFDAASIEVAAFHESFGDMSAILSALQLPSVREGVLAETAGVLRRSSRLSRLAEQLGWAIRQSVPSAVEPDCLRNAVNTFFYRDPDTLPTMAPATSLSSEPHSFSRVFTGAFFEGLAGMLATTDTKNEAALLQVSQDMGTILVEGISAASVVPTFMSRWPPACSLSRRPDSPLKAMKRRCGAGSSATAFCRLRWRWRRRMRPRASQPLQQAQANRRRFQRCNFPWPSMASGSRPSWFMPPPNPSAFRLPARRLPSGRRPRRARIRRPSLSSRICCDGDDSRWPKPLNQRPKSYAPRRRRPTKPIPTNCDAKEDRWCCAGFVSTAGLITVEYRRSAPV